MPLDLQQKLWADKAGFIETPISHEALTTWPKEARTKKPKTNQKNPQNHKTQPKPVTEHIKCSICYQ